MNTSIEAILREPVLVRRSKHGRKLVEVDRVWIDYWDGTMGGEPMGHPEVMAFPLFEDESVAHWHPLGEWHGLEDGKPNWVEYLDELNAYVPGNYGDWEFAQYE